MKFKVACHKPSDDSFFVEEIALSSTAFVTPEEQAQAVRRIYTGVMPPIEVLGITKLVEVERGFF